MTTIRPYGTTPDDTPGYRRAYERGWRASKRVSGMDAADSRREPEAWYDGYLDYAADRKKWHLLRCTDHDNCP